MLYYILVIISNNTFMREFIYIKKGGNWMNYLDKISELESKSNLTIEDVKGFENEIKSLNLDENMQTYVQSKILKLKELCMLSGEKPWKLKGS